MAGSVNKVMLIGNVGKDPEIRSTQSGGRFANLTLATSESWKDKSTGERKENTQWHRIVVWNEALVGVVERFVKKGSKIYLQGQLETRKWTNDEGKDQYSTEIVLRPFGSEIVLLDKRQDGDNSDTSQDNHQRSHDAQAPKQANHYVNNDLDDDIPF